MCSHSLWVLSEAKFSHFSKPFSNPAGIYTFTRIPWMFTFKRRGCARIHAIPCLSWPLTRPLPCKPCFLSAAFEDWPQLNFSWVSSAPFLNKAISNASDVNTHYNTVQLPVSVLSQDYKLWIEINCLCRRGRFCASQPVQHRLHTQAHVHTLDLYHYWYSHDFSFKRKFPVHFVPRCFCFTHIQTHN